MATSTIMITEQEFRALLKKRQGTRSSREAAPELKVSPQFLNKVTGGRLHPGPHLAKMMGYEQIFAYRRLPEKPKKAAPQKAAKPLAKAAAKGK